MNNKMVINTQLQTIESKIQNKEAEQKQNHRFREHIDGCQMRRGQGDEQKSTNWQLQNNHGDVKDCIEIIVAKEYICMNHGHGQWYGDCLREWGGLGGGGQRGQLGQL